MQSLTISKPKQVQPNLVEQGWIDETSITMPKDGMVGNMEEALLALTEAEHIIRSQAEQIRHLENMAMTDELTGLLNRRGFIMALQRELALARRHTDANGVLVMADLDGFKTINDRMGHSVGDDYLQAVAHTLSTSVRTSDVVARLGGDEFAILFTHMTEDVGLERLNWLHKNFNSRMLQCGDKSLPLRASFGMAPYAGADTPEEILANADLKLYAHKASNKKKA